MRNDEALATHPTVIAEQRQSDAILTTERALEPRASITPPQSTLLRRRPASHRDTPPHSCAIMTFHAREAVPRLLLPPAADITSPPTLASQGTPRPLRILR